VGEVVAVHHPILVQESKFKRIGVVHLTAEAPPVRKDPETKTKNQWIKKPFKIS